VAAATANAPAAPEKNKKGKLLLIVGAVVLLLAGAGGGWWATQSRTAAADAKPAEPVKPPAQYHALSPAFVVNLTDADATRYLQADVQLMTRDPETLKAIETHAPAIRNRLLLLFGGYSAAQLAERSAKEKLQKQALSEVRAALKAEVAPDKIEALYFTSLVTQ